MGLWFGAREGESVQILDICLKIKLSGLGVKWIVVFENKKKILYSRVFKRLKNAKIPKIVFTNCVFFSATFPHINGLFPVGISQNRAKSSYHFKAKKMVL